MAVMTADERSAFHNKTGWGVKTKCDHCGTPIVSTLSYRGKHNRDYCKRSCLAAAEPDQVVQSQIRKEKTMSETTAPAAETKKKKKAAPAEDAPKAKKSAKAPKPVKKDAPEKKAAAANKTTRNPFRAGSAIAAAFELCFAGTTRAKLNKFCEEQEIGAARVFACMKAGEYGEEKWKYKEEEDGSIKIVFLKKKAA